jgi:hypothetical protein
LQVTVEEESVRLALVATREQVIAALRRPDKVAPPPETIKVETPVGVQQVTVEHLEAPTPEAPKPVVVEVKTPEKPKVIRIVGLDDGPKEISFPAAKPEKQNP